MGLITGTYRVTTRAKVYFKDAYQNIRRRSSSPSSSSLETETDTEATPSPYRLQRWKFEVQTILWPHWIRRPFREHIKENDFSCFKECGELLWFARYSLPEDQQEQTLKRVRAIDEATHFQAELFDDDDGFPESLDNVDKWLFLDGLRFSE